MQQDSLRPISRVYPRSPGHMGRRFRTMQTNTEPKPIRTHILHLTRAQGMQYYCRRKQIVLVTV